MQMVGGVSGHGSQGSSSRMVVHMVGYPAGAMAVVAAIPFGRLGSEGKRRLARAGSVS